MSPLLKISALACLFALASGPAAFAGAGTCTDMTIVDHYEDSSTSSSTTSKTFVDVPNTRFDFTQVKDGCVVVTFSGESWAAGANRLIHLQAFINGVGPGDPGAVQFSGDDDENNNQHWSRSHTFTFVFSNVPAGNYTFHMRWRSADGTIVLMGKHTTVLTHS